MSIVDMRRLFFEVQGAQQKVREAHATLQTAEEELVRYLVETKSWDFLKPVYSRIVREMNTGR